MLDAVFAVPGDLHAPTGGYAYARKLLELVPTHGVNLRHVLLPGGFPQPNADELAETARRFEAIDADVVLVDGLAYGATPPEVISRVRAPIVGLVHHPLAFETGQTSVRQAELMASEAEALALAHRVIASSPLTARLLVADFNVPADKITMAEPGTEPARRARGTGAPVTLLAIGAVSPRKGYEVLVRALAGVLDFDWHLTIAGSLDRNPDAVASLKRALADARLSERITLAGAVAETELDRLYDAADVFVSSSLFEGYGMVLAEAIARGLPLVASTGGGAADTVPESAGLKIPPGDVPALRKALRDMIANPLLRRRYADASYAAAQDLPRWSQTARKVASVLREAAR